MSSKDLKKNTEHVNIKQKHREQTEFFFTLFLH